MKKLKCEGCGCTQEHACPGGCFWIETDKCNSCFRRKPDGTIEKIPKLKFRRDFKKIVWGYIEVVAENEKEAEKLADSGYEDEFDNKSDYSFTSDWHKAEQT